MVRHWVWLLDQGPGGIYSVDTGIKPDDSNAVICAKAFIELYREIDGISDEMSMRDIDLISKLTPAVESAAEVLRERELL